ncbi:putative methyltransferase YcgJ [Actinomadura rubteroloni]|uniref:Putative methyltransferase YcgJ n=1 Tax=Actinomadura rubteroloni TaxID=1926885 RepID=A0A2P4UIF9_9ACTN|nr:methyltransferase domain-containing protein [Actinomadura rubteroloni]POM24830.1 putative methyltransferase YcgJ [Actinomadura rubteroloni]
MPTTHDERIVAEFTKQAVTFADPSLNGAFVNHLDRLIAFADPELDLDDIVLEVAAGTGIVGRALAPRVRHVTALDLTPAMLATGKCDADRAGLTNVTFTLGDATALPYLDKSYTLIITRFSVHQVADPARMIAEMARVGRPGAALIIADIVRPDGLDGDPDRIERLRDPSHGTLLTADRIAALVEDAGAEVKRTDGYEIVRPLEPWLASARTPSDVADQIRAELTAELAGGPATGMRPVRKDGELHFTHSYLHLQANVG